MVLNLKTSTIHVLPCPSQIQGLDSDWLLLFLEIWGTYIPVKYPPFIEQCSV